MRSRGCTAVLELLATPARTIIIAADPGRRARRRGLPGGATQEKIDVREIFGLVRFYTDDYLPVVFFTKRDDLFAFGHRLHANYRRPFIGSQLRHSGFSLRVSNSSLSACPRFRNLHGQCRWRRKRVPKWRRSGPLPGEPFGVSLSLFSEVLSGTARSGQGRAVVGRGEANP